MDILDHYGAERLWLNSACDWGVSIPLIVPRTGLEMRRRGWTAAAREEVLFDNPRRLLSQNPRFQLREE